MRRFQTPPTGLTRDAAVRRLSERATVIGVDWDNLDRRVLRARDHLPRIRRLNLPDARIYDLRHLHIMYTITAGVDVRTVADRAGHKDPGYLIRRYAHAVAAAQGRAADVASRLLAKPAGLER